MVITNRDTYHHREERIMLYLREGEASNKKKKKKKSYKELYVKNQRVKIWLLMSLKLEIIKRVYLFTHYPRYLKYFVKIYLWCKWRVMDVWPQSKDIHCKK